MKTTKNIVNKWLQLGLALVFFGLLNVAAQTGEYRMEGDMGVTGKLDIQGATHLNDLSVHGFDLRVLYVRGGDRHEPRRVIYQGESQPWTNWEDEGDDGLAVMLIDRSDGSVISHINYSIDSLGLMVEHLNNVDEDNIVVITSQGDWNVEKSTGFELGIEILTKMGGTSGVMSYTIGSYALIGIPGMGSGIGLDRVTGIDLDGNFKAVDFTTMLIGGPDAPYTLMGRPVY